MTDAGHKPDIHLLFALPDEAKPFRSLLGTRCVSLTVSGVGAKNTERAVREIVARHGASGILIVAGFCGGLNPQMSVTDLVLVQSVCSHVESKSILFADSLLLSTAESVQVEGTSLHEGAMVSVPKVLGSVEEKADCGQKTSAVAVDMETYSAAKIATELGMRWLGVRVVTDGAEQAMPLDFNAFNDASGNPNRTKIVMEVLKRPALIPALIRLGRDSAQGASLLKAYITTLIDRLME